MRRVSVTLAATAVVLALGAAMPVSAYAADGGRTFVVEMTGGAERPGPGDPDGSGLAQITINPGQGSVCWSISYQNLDTVVAAHIHRAPSTEPGAVVIGFSPVSGGCTTADRALLREIFVDPSGFYVNVHTEAFRPGAIRGQLSR